MEHHNTDVTVVRQQDFECAEPVDISVELLSGRLDIHLVESAAGQDAVAVQVRPDTTGSPVWSTGLTGLLTWLGGQAGATTPDELAAEAVRSTVIDFTGQRITVRTPRDTPLRAIPLMIQVSAPAGSSVLARSGSADVTVDGVADWLDAATGSGQVRMQRCTGSVDVRTGSGDVRLGSALGAVRVRTGSGSVDVVSLNDHDSADNPTWADNHGRDADADSTASVQTGSGNVRFGVVARDVEARTGSGDLIVVDAMAGRLELISGSGQLRVGIHAGVRAEVDISSGSGQARSDLPVGGPPPEGDVGLWVRARTGSGNALVTAARS